MTDELKKLQRLYKKTTVYVVRCDHNNNLRDSAPCKNCMTTIKELNIKRIVYSSTDSTFVSATPASVDITDTTHTSSGSNYLKKRYNQPRLHPITFASGGSIKQLFALNNVESA